MHYAKQTYYSRIRRDSVCNTFQNPIITSVIDAKKITAWGESGFPARFLGNLGFNDFKPPADAGPDQTAITGTTVLLDGSASEDSGPWKSNVTYSWEKTSGTDVTLPGEDTATPSFTAPGARGDLEFTLTVTGRGMGILPYTKTDSVQVRVKTETIPPSLETATVNVASLVLTYDEDLDGTSVPAAGAYTVTVNGDTRDLAANNPVSIAGRTVTLTLASPVEYGDTVTLIYTVPDTNPVQDPEPNSALGFTGQEVTNNTITAPGALAGLVSVAGNEEVLLIWQAPESGGQVESYEYRYAEGSTVPPATAWSDAGTTTRFVVTSLTNDRLHAFEVRARNRSANGPAASVTMTPADLPLPVVSLSDGDQTIQEGPDVELTVTATLSAPSTRQVTVRAWTSPGTATPPHDFVNLLDTMTFVPGETSQTLSVPISNDLIYERDETFTVALSHPTNATVSDTQGTATVTIEDDDPKPTARVSDASAQEGGAIEFTVRYATDNNCVSDVASSVDWAVTIESGDTASADDLPLADGTLSLDRCLNSATVTVQTTQDVLDEPDETFTITLSDPVDAQLPDDPTATGTIRDDDESPSAPTDLAAASRDGRVILSWEASSSAGTSPITGHEYRSKTETGDYGLWTPIPDSAPSGDNADNATSYTATGLENETEYTFQVRAVSAAGPSAAATSNTVTPYPPIMDVERAITGAIEGDSFSVAFTLTPESHQTVTVDYATVDGSATAGADYTEASGKITFEPGNTRKEFTIDTVDDDIFEKLEVFDLRLSNPVNTELARTERRYSISDNDSPPTITMPNASAGEGSDVAFTVTLSDAIGSDLEIDYTTADVTATAGTDYTAAPDMAQVVIPAGQTTATIRIATTGDSVDEDNETFTLTLTRTNTGRITLPGAATGTITDDDTRGVTVDPTELHVPENRNATYTVVLDSEPTGEVTVTPSLASEGDQDITLQSTAALTFTTDNWRRPQSVQVNAADDADEVNGQRVINHAVAGADYASETADSVTAKEVDDEINIPSTGAPSITGAPQVGGTLTADTGGISDENGKTKAETDDAGFAYTYRWIRVDGGADTNIAGATLKTYVPVVDDVGKTLKVAVSFTDDIGNAEGPFPSAETAAVLASRPGAVTGLEAALGDARVTLTWTAAPDGGSPVTKHRYRQRAGDNAYRNWADIPNSAEGGTNGASYTVTGLTNNTAYTFQVRAVNARGEGPEATSNEVTPLPSTIQFERATQSTVESNAGVHVCLETSHPPSRRVSIGLRYAGAPEEGTAIPGVDFLPEPGRFVYPADENRACFDVEIINDDLVEPPVETFYIYLVDAPGAVIGEPARLGVDILDIDTATVEIAPQSTAAEGSPLSFTVTLSQPLTYGEPGEGLTVTYRIEDITTQGDDYTPPAPLEVVIPNGITTAAFEIPTAPDHVDEDHETFTVTLTATSHARFQISETAKTATATILDDDTAGVSLSRQSLSISEGETRDYTVVLTSKPSADVTITIAGQTTDITLDRDTLTFTPGDWNIPQTVTVRGALDDETTTLTHTAASGDSDYQGIQIPSLEVKVVSLILTLEAPAGQGAVRAGERAYYRIRMGGISEPLDEWVSASMDYRWKGGGIVSHVKQALEGSLDLDGDGSKFTWTSYTVVPEDHTGGALTVALRVEEDYDTGDPPSVCIDIIDANGRLRECEEPMGEPRIWAESELVEEGAGPLRFKVVLERPVGQTVTANYETFDIVEAGPNHTALAGQDYTAMSGTVTFEPGELEKVIEVTVVDDNLEENEEYVGFRLSNFSGAQPRPGWVEIVGAIADPSQ